MTTSEKVDTRISGKMDPWWNSNIVEKTWLCLLRIFVNHVGVYAIMFG